jgi:thiamine-phosphate pyrophosphorylase
MVTTRGIPTGVVVLTDRRSAARPLRDVVAAAVDGGAGWVVLRETDLGYAERHALAEALRALLPPGHLIVAGSDPLGGDAIHLPAATPLPISRRSAHPQPSETPTPVKPGGSLRLVGRSCHSRDELDRLSREDYVTLSPIYPTATKPGYGPALGAGGAAHLQPTVPWLALGGVDSAARAAECVAAGAAGVAVLGAVMRAEDPAGVVRDITAGLAA